MGAPARPCRSRAGRLCIALALALLLGACGGGSRKAEAPQYYTVRTGDTLYSIGWRHGLDYRDIARWNGIGRDYRIQVGQRLELRRPPGGSPAAPAGRGVELPASLPEPPAWAWPVADGRVVGALRQPSGGVGLRIDGTLGQAVLAAADGKVVYTGSGLRGYGQLVIVSHERGWLSAYGHNSSVLVAEGEQVRAGQRIATMGLGVAQQAMLYFEVRVDGKPVDPLSQLPRR